MKLLITEDDVGSVIDLDLLSRAYNLKQEEVKTEEQVIKKELTAKKKPGRKPKQKEFQQVGNDHKKKLPFVVEYDKGDGELEKAILPYVSI